MDGCDIPYFPHFPHLPYFRHLPRLFRLLMRMRVIYLFIMAEQNVVSISPVSKHECCFKLCKLKLKRSLNKQTFTIIILHQSIFGIFYFIFYVGLLINYADVYV